MIRHQLASVSAIRSTEVATPQIKQPKTAEQIYLFLHRRLFLLSGKRTNMVQFRLTHGLESMVLRQLCDGSVNTRQILQSDARIIADAQNPQSHNHAKAKERVAGVLRSLDVVCKNLCYQADTSLRTHGYKLLRNTFISC